MGYISFPSGASKRLRAEESGSSTADPVAVVLAVRQGEPSMLDGADLRLTVARIDMAP